MSGPTFSNSYMITNRSDPGATWKSSITPTASGTLTFMKAAGQYAVDSDRYTRANDAPSASMPPDFQAALEADLARAVAGGGRQLTLYIHGLAYLLADACLALGTIGTNLAAHDYRGLVIGFSWPSYGSLESVTSYSSGNGFPPATSSGTIRDNIHGSAQSLLNLLAMLSKTCKKMGVKLNLICHSEGNYMIMISMYALSRSPGPAFPDLAGSGPFVDQILMVAADINNGALEHTQGWPPFGAGQGAWIGQYSNAVTAYRSTADDKLSNSQTYWGRYHNTKFPGRLGLEGPASFDSARFLPNAYGLDCSLVANGQHPHAAPIQPSAAPDSWLASNVHESYFHIPQILRDMTQTLTDVPPSQVANRISTGNQSFQMKRV